MASKFLFRNSGLLASTPRFSFKPPFLSLAPFQKSIFYKRPFLTASCVALDQKSNRLIIKWNDDLSDEYPVVWLRDNCQCPACFDQSTNSRTINFSEFQTDSKANSVILKQHVEVNWEDGHKSVFDFNWLRRRSFNKNQQQKWVDSKKAPYKTWVASDFKRIPTFDFHAVMNDDVPLLEWLQTLGIWGVSLLKNVPNSLGNAGRLANRVGFIKKTHYGEEYSIKAKANAKTLAYTQSYLQLHTDSPYYEYMPGINLLHCYVQYSGVGGDSLMSDGFQIAEWLRENDPDTYKCLTETEVTWSDNAQEHGNRFYKINHAPVICQSSNHKIERINYNHPMRDSHMIVPIDQAENWYRAVKKFHNLALDPRNLVEFKLEPGQLLAFDNLRILHGRTSFGDTIKGERHVQGAYLDWDEARSRIRVLQSEIVPSEEM